MKYIRILVVLVFLAFIGITGGKILYDKVREPAHYRPKSEIIYITPVSKPSLESTRIQPKKPGVSALLPGARWVAQTFNNCGPATTSMLLQYFGFDINQNETKAKLRTNVDDKNVFTYEIADYIRKDYGVESKLFYNGDIQTLKTLITNGFYVVVEDWLHPNEDIGHTTILRGFDDEQGVFIADDSYMGINITYPYEQFYLTQWKPFNREYLPVYKAGNEELLRAIVGLDWDEGQMYENAIKRSEEEISQNEKDMYAWFNLGTSQFALGNYKAAKAAFETSRGIGWPKRMLWYQIQPVQTYNKLGEYQKALDSGTIGLAGNDSFAELHVEKAIAYKGLGDIAKARAEANTALLYAPKLKIAYE